MWKELQTQGKKNSFSKNSVLRGVRGVANEAYHKVKALLEIPRLHLQWELVAKQQSLHKEVDPLYVMQRTF